MGAFSIWHLVILSLFSGVFVIPAWRILQKAGYPGVLSLLVMVPLLNLVLLWVFAFANWPNAKRD